MRTNVRIMLDKIDEMLSKGDQDAADLAAILTALRGPDELSVYHLKEITTVPVRRLALPKTAKASRYSHRKMRMSFQGLDKINIPTAFVPTHHATSHFFLHIRQAKAAIENAEVIP